MKIVTLGVAALLLTLSAACNKGADAAKGAATISQAPPVQVEQAGGAPDGAALCAECGKPEAQCICEGHPPAADKDACTDPNCADAECKDGKDCANCLDCKGKDPAACKDCPDCKGKAAQIATTKDGIRIVDATAVDVDPHPYVGRVAMHGKVGDVLAEKGVFTLVDLKKMPGCTDGCCPKTNIQISVPQSAYSGTLPKAGEDVLVVCKLSTTDAGGYAVEVEEVRQGEKTLLKRAKAA